MDRLDDLRRGRCAGQGGDQRRRLRTGKRRKDQHLTQMLAAEVGQHVAQRVVAADVHGAIRAHHEQGRSLGGEPADEVLEEEETRSIGPVQVIQAEQQALGRTED